MTTAFERILDALRGHGSTVRASGATKATAQCPAHDDGSPSLSITGIEGQTLVHCHAGCATVDVLAALDLGLADLFDTRRGADYRYDNGRVVHRRLDKSFPQSHTDNPPELYRLGKVRAAVAAGRPVFVVEGEKDVHALEALGVTATCAPMGAGKWSKIDPSPLYGGNVLVVADQDEPGREHAAQVYASLVGRADVGIFAPKVGKDAADHIAAGHGVEDFARTDAPTTPEPAPDHRDTDERKSAATVLVELAQTRYTFGVSDDGEPFALPRTGDPVVRLLRGGKRGLRAELARAYFTDRGKAVSQQALADALLVIEGIAGDAEPEPLAQRVAHAAGAWWIDLGDNTGDALRIAGNGWSIAAPPIKFRRSVLTAALPRPVTGGQMADLWELLNVAEADRPLVLAWLVAALIEPVPHPILSLAGEQGTGKTTAARILVSLIDPSPVPLRKAPRDADSWITAASGSWVVALDNLSAVPDWLSDTLCRAVTGDGDVRRQLYTDAGLALFAFRRCILLNGIDLGAVRGDLADRLLVIDLDVIDDHHRRLDGELADRWRDAHPRVLGALLDLAARVASVLPSVRLDRSPRMADFARILAAVDQTLGTAGLPHYLDRASTLAADALTADPFVAALLAQLDAEFEGTSAELLARIGHANGDKAAPKGWPANARQLTTLLKRQAPVMRRAGWTITDLPAGHDNALRWKLRRPEIARNGHSQHSRRSQEHPGASDASVASIEYTQSQDDETPRDFYAAVDRASSAASSDLDHCPVCGTATRPSAAGHQSLCIDCTVAELAAARQETTA